MCIRDRSHSQAAGPGGSVLEQDGVLHETLETFVHSKLLERAVHVKGYGAFGFFQPYESMKAYTTLNFLQNPNQRTPTLSRLSLIHISLRHRAVGVMVEAVHTGAADFSIW